MILFSKKILRSLLLMIFSSMQVLAGNTEINSYYKNVFLGEQKTPLYFGPLYPSTFFDDGTGSLVLEDKNFKDNYLNQEIQQEAFGLYHFWFKEIVEKSNCPDETLSENIDYIRYLYRLVTISYLFESLKINHKTSKELGAGNICSLSYNDVFGSCTPQSEDMKKFKERVYGKFVNEISRIKVQPFSKKEREHWMTDFQHSTSLTTDPVHSRLHEWCMGNKKNCRTLPEKEIEVALGNFCKNDTAVIKQLCSEKDQFYGLSQVEKATDLIKSSNAFQLINQSGMGEECLRRYSKLFSSKEIPAYGLSRLYPLIYAHLLKSNSRYLQGELFLPGALKEFDMKGLSDFLTALKPPKQEPAVIKPKPRPKAKPVVVIAPEPVVEKPVEVVSPPPVPVAVEPKVSEFEKKTKLITEEAKAQFYLDMEAFRDDFEFTQEMIVELSAPMKKFQTRSALNDMKAYDLLGTKAAPVGLVFIKFLLDTENHQGLYNIVNVLGDKFYVVNDIEKKDNPVYMWLRNDESTKNRWQIILLKDPKK